MGGNLSLWINKELREEMEGNGYIHSVYIVLKGKNNISGFFFFKLQVLVRSNSFPPMFSLHGLHISL